VSRYADVAVIVEVATDPSGCGSIVVGTCRDSSSHVDREVQLERQSFDVSPLASSLY
jgi:hypothetical protein